MVEVNKLIALLSISLVLVSQKANCDSNEPGKSEKSQALTNKKFLQIKSIPGYPGTRSDLYEIIMEPYYFYIGKKGVAEIKSHSDGGIANGPEGKLSFQQLPDGLRINGTINGLPGGLYRLHVNEKGVLSKGCKSTGANYNPYKTGEGQDPLKDIGDLGDIEVGDKTTEVNLLSKYLTLTGASGVIGRTVVLEKKETSGEFNESFAACGIIGVA